MTDVRRKRIPLLWSTVGEQLWPNVFVLRWGIDKSERRKIFVRNTRIYARNKFFIIPFLSETKPDLSGLS